MFIVLALVAILLLKFAKKRRGVAIAFGILVQMFSPDPLVERTIETVIVEKRQIRKQHDGQKLDESDE